MLNQKGAQSPPGSHRRCARHVEHTGSYPAGSSGDISARGEQAGLGRECVIQSNITIYKQVSFSLDTDTEEQLCILYMIY